jgi:hypothetical protein
VRLSQVTEAKRISLFGRLSLAMHEVNAELPHQTISMSNIAKDKRQDDSMAVVIILCGLVGSGKVSHNA